MTKVKVKPAMRVTLAHDAMLMAVFADIHANRQAFSACLDDSRASGAQRFVLLGDYVGYGADPEWTVETVMQLAGDGAPAVLGNHDSAVANPHEAMNMDDFLAGASVMGAALREAAQ